MSSADLLRPDDWPLNHSLLEDRGDDLAAALRDVNAYSMGDPGFTSLPAVIGDTEREVSGDPEGLRVERTSRGLLIFDGEGSLYKLFGALSPDRIGEYEFFPGARVDEGGEIVGDLRVVEEDGRRRQYVLSGDGGVYLNSVEDADGTTYYGPDGKTPTLRLRDGYIEIVGMGDGSAFLKFAADRSWQFRQSGAGGAARLQLQALVDSKSFDIVAPDGSVTATFRTINGAANGYADINSRPYVAPTMLNGWVHFGGTEHETPGYVLAVGGIVHLKGFIKDGMLGGAAWTLPAGFRPGKRQVIGTIANNGTANVVARLDVFADGSVVPVSGGTTWFSVNNVSFRAEG